MDDEDADDDEEEEEAGRASKFEAELTAERGGVIVEGVGADEVAGGGGLIALLVLVFDGLGSSFLNATSEEDEEEEPEGFAGMVGLE